MVKITYMPIKEIVIHEITESENNELFKIISQGIQASGSAGAQPWIQWAEGIAFITEFFPDSEEVLADKITGKIHMIGINFTRIDKFESEIQIKSNEMGQTIRLFDVSHNDNLVKIAKYLKSNKWKKQPKSK
ncbi:hypothetical protein ACFL96_18765 [Thermoproteota archaeon]